MKKLICLLLSAIMLISAASMSVTAATDQEVSTRILVLEDDSAPAGGRAKTTNNETITLDQSNTSVVFDQGKDQKVNVIKLTDNDDISRITSDSLSIWYSDSNRQYKRVDDFKFLKTGKNIYLYGFEVDKRYVKVHYAHEEEKGADFVGNSKNIISAYYEEVFGAGEGSISTLTATVKNTTSSDYRDQAVKLSKSELGITGEDASIRVTLLGEYLYHYVDGDDLIVRIPALEAGGTLFLDIMYGMTGALDISNKEAVREVVYGAKESFVYENYGDGCNRRWLFTINKGTKFPNGEVADKEVLISWSNTTIYGSYNGGRTWFDYGKIPSEIKEDVSSNADPVSGGFIFDDVTGRIFYEKHKYKSFNAKNMSASDCVNVVFYSDDGGKTWALADYLEAPTINGTKYTYALSYSDGIKVHSYDGAGPGIDFVFPSGAQLNNHGAFCTLVAYSKDGGFTWQYSDSVIVYGSGNAFEGGVSEAYILDREDGTLVLYARNQFENVNNFAQVYSYDNGLTWTDAKTKAEWQKQGNKKGVVKAFLSTIYTTNTQPIMFRYDNAPLFNWGGNNICGGTSYIRNPLNFAVSHDGLDTWVNIQNVFSKTTHESYYYAGAHHYVTNASLKKVGKDEMVITFERFLSQVVSMNVTNFTDFFYRTKGVYDSFENNSLVAEGWLSDVDSLSVSAAEASDGKRSLLSKIPGTFTRSIPYFTDGVISFDIFVDSKTNVTYELQQAYSNTKGKQNLFALNVSGLKLTCGKTSFDLKEGWNTIELDLDLAAGKGSMSVNAEASKSITVNNSKGAYACYFTVYQVSRTHYLDEFYADYHTDAKIYLTEESEAKVNALKNAINALGSKPDTATVEKLLADYDAMNRSEQLSVSNIYTLLSADYNASNGEVNNGGSNNVESNDMTVVVIACSAILLVGGVAICIIIVKRRREE